VKPVSIDDLDLAAGDTRILLHRWPFPT
jgi:hypothetical protein